MRAVMTITALFAASGAAAHEIAGQGGAIHRLSHGSSGVDQVVVLVALGILVAAFGHRALVRWRGR